MHGSILKLGILSYQNGIRKGMQDFYPLLKWRNELRREGIKFSFHSNHETAGLTECDVIFISHRYLRYHVYQSGDYADEKFIIPYLEKWKSLGKRVVLFDYMAASGCRYFELADYVDVLVKRQLLRKREHYLDSPVKYAKPYVWEYKLTDAEKREFEEKFSQYRPCSKENLHKLELGWNTGMVDHRHFPLKRFYPFSTERLLNSIYSNPTFEKVDRERPFGAVFRGQIKDDRSFSFQRNELIKILRTIDPEYRSFTGSKVSKKKYIEELKQCKVCVSPYGWGEVCYRDFEAAIYGCILIKPDMSHIETWPHIFEESETYIPVQWDMSDAKEAIIDAIENYDNYKTMAQKLQASFRSQIEDSEYIVEKIKTLCGVQGNNKP